MRGWRVIVSVIALLAMAGAGGALLLPTPPPFAAAQPAADKADKDKDGVPDSKDKCPNTPKGTQVNDQGCPKKKPDPDAKCTPNAAIAAVLGVKESNLLVGSGKVKWDKAPEEQPMNAFSQRELTSTKKLTSFTTGDSKGSRAVRALIKQGETKAQAKRAISGKGWYAVQVKGGKTVALPGNYQLLNPYEHHPSTSKPWEVIWVYVPSTCKGNDVTITVGVRAWCGNFQDFTRKE